MSTKYKNKNLIIPIQLWCGDKNLFRIQLPSPLKTTPTEWIFDDSPLKKYNWTLKKRMYALNKSCFPPVPKGCQLIDVIQNKNAPYQTLKIKIGSTLSDTVNQRNIGFEYNEQFIVYTYFIENTIPFVYWFYYNMYNEFEIYGELEPNINDSSFIEKVNANNQKIILYFLQKNDQYYWKGTTESLCIPSSNKHDFPTLTECQNKIYPKMKNEKVWVNNNSEPIDKYMKWWSSKNKNKNLNLNKNLTKSYFDRLRYFQEEAISNQKKINIVYYIILLSVNILLIMYILVLIYFFH
jgi:hypothetical protein